MIPDFQFPKLVCELIYTGLGLDSCEVMADYPPHEKVGSRNGIVLSGPVRRGVSFMVSGTGKTKSTCAVWDVSLREF